MAFKFVAYIEFSTLYYFDLGGREGGKMQNRFKLGGGRRRSGGVE